MTQRVTVTHDQIQAASRGETPEVIPAPGAGQAIRILRVDVASQTIDYEIVPLKDKDAMLAEPSR